jgi:hypothetical protein
MPCQIPFQRFMRTWMYYFPSSSVNCLPVVKGDSNRYVLALTSFFCQFISNQSEVHSPLLPRVYMRRGTGMLVGGDFGSTKTRNSRRGGNGRNRTLN